MKWKVQDGVATLSTKNLKVIVCKHVDVPKKWVMHCWQLNVSVRPLDSVELEDAQVEALRIVRNLIDELQHAINLMQRK